MTRLTLSAFGLLLLAGCATNLATLQTAQTLDPMAVRVGVGGGAYVPVGTLSEAKSLAEGEAGTLEQIEAGNGSLPDEEMQRRIIRLAASLAVFPPAPVGEASGRLGLFEGFDVGFKWSTSAWRLDAKLRLRGEDNKGVIVAIAGGIEIYTFDVRLWDLDRYLEQDVSQLFQYVRFENPQRYDAEAALLVSGNIGGIFIPYLVAKYRAALYRLPLVLTVETPVETFVHEETLSGVAHYAGGAFGFALGPKLVRLYVEVNAGMAFAPTEVMGVTEELGGPAVYPAAGVVMTLF